MLEYELAYSLEAKATSNGQSPHFRSQGNHLRLSCPARSVRNAGTSKQAHQRPPARSLLGRDLRSKPRELLVYVYMCMCVCVGLASQVHVRSFSIVKPRLRLLVFIQRRPALVQLEQVNTLSTMLRNIGRGEQTFRTSQRLKTRTARNVHSVFFFFR